jgi:luciferase family oxidoreductase group 1
MFTLSILDQSPILNGESAHQALLRTIRTAQLAEEYGFHRYWVSEHHQSKEVAGSSPEVLVSHLLAVTNKIKIGSGGVMLSHYSPYKVAENFHLLANLAPGRVDLGIGKAPGGLPQSTKALQYGVLDAKATDFNKRLIELKDYILQKVELKAEPIPKISPLIYLLGGSKESALFAAQQQIPYVFAQFINGDEQQLLEAAKVYKESYPEGQFLAGVAVIAADSDEQAQSLAKNTDLYRVYLETGEKYTLVNFESADRFGKESNKQYRVERVPSPAISGTIETLQSHFERYTQYGVDEFIIHNPILEEQARLYSLQLLSTFNAIAQY